MSTHRPSFPLRGYRAAGIVVVATGLFALVSAKVWHPSTAQVTSDHLMTILPLIAAVAAFVVATRQTGRMRTGWLLLGAWGTLSASGNALWTYYELVAHTDPFPSLADVGYLGGNLCLVAGVISFTSTLERASRMRTLLDAALIGGSVFLVSWAVALRSVYAASGGTFVEQAVGLAYPVIDVIFVSLVVFVASHVTISLRAPVVLIGVGLVGWAIADTAFAYLTTIGTYQSGSPVDAGWIGGDALIALAAIQAVRVKSGSVDAQSEPRKVRVFLPYVIAGLALAVGFIVQLAQGKVDPLILSGQMALLLLVVGRQFFVVLEQKTVTIDHMRSVDEMKNQILRAVSHELRTPLTVIKGIGEMMALEEGALTPQQKNLVERLMRNTDRLEEYLVSLLDLERLTRGVLEPARQPTEVVALTARIAETIPHEGYAIVLDRSETIWGTIDPAQVERVVENLIVNAVRHTPEGTTICVDSERRDEGVLITVSDDGPGVGDDMKDQIFEPFAQVKDSLNVSRGSGLGLALVAKFAELHGGRAWVEDNPGGGARFRVLLHDDAAQEGL